MPEFVEFSDRVFSLDVEPDPELGPEWHRLVVRVESGRPLSRREAKRILRHFMRELERHDGIPPAERPHGMG